MAFTSNNRVKELTTDSTTGRLTLNGAMETYFTFSSSMNVGDTFYYSIVHQTENEVEVGFGQLVLNGALYQLERLSVIRSSNSNNFVQFSSGSKEISQVFTSEQLAAITSGNAPNTAGYLLAETTTALSAARLMAFNTSLFGVTDGGAGGNYGVSIVPERTRQNIAFLKDGVTVADAGRLDVSGVGAEVSLVYTPSTNTMLFLVSVGGSDPQTSVNTQAIVSINQVLSVVQVSLAAAVSTVSVVGTSLAALQTSVAANTSAISVLQTSVAANASAIAVASAAITSLGTVKLEKPSSNGFVVYNGTSAVAREITVGANLTVTTSSGVTANPQIDLVGVALVSADQRFTGKNTFTGSTYNTLTTLVASTTVTIDMAAGNLFLCSLTTATNFIPVNLSVGWAGILYIAQLTAGGKAATYNSLFKFPGGSTPSNTTTSAAVDMLAIVCRDVSAADANMLQDFR